MVETSNSRGTFWLIDGHAQIYRAYFAPFRDLTGPTGEPVKAVFVFSQMLMGLAAGVGGGGGKRPDYLAMVIDAHGDEGLERTKLYPAYKANRSAPPEDFRPQADRILAVVRDSGVPIFHLPGFEADDVLATLAKRLSSEGFDVVLVSKDKDLRQVLTSGGGGKGGGVRMYDVGAGKFTTAESLREEMGFGPEEAVEVQTLMGDKTDNVPGIPGVGDKTAVELIRQFGTARAVIERADEITKPKLRENAKAFASMIDVTRELVTLRTDLEVPGFTVERCAFRGFEVEGMKRHFAELGFTALARRLDEFEGGGKGSSAGATDTPAPASAPAKKSKAVTPADTGGDFGGLFGGMGTGPNPVPGGSGAEGGEAAGGVGGDMPLLATSHGLDYRLVNTPELFEAFVGELRRQKLFAFDTETDGLGAMYSEAVGFSFSWGEGTGWYVAVQGPPGEPVLDVSVVVEGLRGVLEDAGVGKVGHNIKYDVLVMRRLGVRVRGLVMDTMVGAFLLDAGRMTFGIDRLAEQWLGFRKIATSELIGTGKNQVSMTRVPTERVARYASEDADVCLRLYNYLRPRLEALPEVWKLAREVETPLVDVLAEMEFNGIAVDPGMLKEQSRVLGERIEVLRGKIAEAAGDEVGGFNPDSPKQLAEVLFTKLGLKPVKKTKTGYSTDVEVLEKLAAEHPVPGLILDYRSLVKLKNTYLDNLTEYVSPKTGRIHTHFNPTGAATGRLSSSDPNLQNIPIRTDEGRRIRLAFVAGDEANVLLSADYSQIELRVLAHFTKEPALLAAFEADEDIHKAVAAEVFGVKLSDVTKEQRGQAKTINFGIIYGVTAFGLSRRIEGLSTGAADKLIRDYNKRFPAIERFLGECVEQARSLGYVKTILGRRRPLPDITSGTVTVRNAAERMAINSVVQGSAADLIKLAMLRVQRRIEAEGRPSRMLLQVHDELVFETPAASVEAVAEMVKAEMTGAMTLAVPLKVEAGWGRSWGEVK